MNARALVIRLARLAFGCASHFSITVVTIVALASAAGGISPAPAEAPPTLDRDEVRRILQHGPWPPAFLADATNRVSGQPAAIALGDLLFFEPRLSASGTMSCVSCHAPDRAWADGERRAKGTELLDRNSPSLWNAGQQRWFGWDGAGDSLWSQNVRPILDRREMASTARHVASVLRSDTVLACEYERAFGPGTLPGRPDDALLADVGKAMAAFIETLVSGRTPFDRFRDALATGDREAAAAYPAAAQRGLRIFVGQGRCNVCHFGPGFTNGEFHDIGIPFFAGRGRVDPGRHGGIQALRASPFNLLGRHNDDGSGRAAIKTRHLELQHRNWGEFKVPSLRNVALTAPYMHDGRFATLREVVRHYSELDEERLHSDGERILRPLRLSAGEIDDLVAFLETLTAPGPPYVERPDRSPCTAR